MNAADLARLAIAKRAYKAAQPDGAEVQTGVRRARLSLRRPKTRRTWFSKGLVLVVVAVGGLAYAKPHALGDLVGDVLPHPRSSAKPGGKLGGVAPAEALDVIAAPAKLSAHPKVVVAAQVIDAATPPEAPAPATEPVAAAGTTEPQDSVPAIAPAQAAAKAAVTSAPHAAVNKSGTQIWRTAGNGDGAPSRSNGERVANSNGSASFSGESSPGSGNVSDWGRVGQALARGDENQALKALRELSDSNDPSTRDKADLGRAQLMMANGNRDGACTLARSLTHRRAGGRIERQAQALLKSCSR